MPRSRATRDDPEDASFLVGVEPAARFMNCVRTPALSSSSMTCAAAPALQQVFDSRPEVLAHNLETVPRISQEDPRPAFRYERSLDLITFASENGLITKSNSFLVRARRATRS